MIGMEGARRKGLRLSFRLGMHCVCCGAAWWATSLGAAAEPTKEAAAEQQAELRDAVRRLGNDSYFVREQATQELLKVGLAAKEFVAEGVDDFDVEVRTRCRRILEVIDAEDYENRVQAFIADVDGKQNRQLPGWTKFRELVGDGRANRELFVEMHRAESVLLESLDESPKAAGELLKAMTAQLQQRAFVGLNWQELSTGTVAALLFVGSDSRITVQDQTSSIMYNVVNQSQFRQSLADGPKSTATRRLLGNWVARRNTPQMAYQNMMLAMQFELREGLDLAVGMISEGNIHASQRAYAVVAVAKLGNREHLAALEKLFEDSSVCATYQTQNKKVVTELRDVALAAAVHLSGQPLADFGFNRVQSNPQTLFYPFSLGFEKPEQRSAALAKWKTWKSTQGKS